MSQPRKFLFETAFTADGEVLGASVSQPSFSTEDLDTARAAGYQAGLERGRQDAQAIAARAQADSVSALGKALRAALANLDDTTAVLQQDATRLALAAARAIAGNALVRFGEANAAALLENALEDLRETPAARLRVHPDIAERMSVDINTIIEQHGLSTRLTLLADAAIEPGGARLDFAGGGYAISPSDLAMRISQLANAHSTKLEETAP